MAYKLGIVSQKGGVCKSTLSRAIGVAYSAAGWNVKIADMDINQASSFEWQKRRLQAGITPVMPVECFGTVSQAMRVESNYDLMIFDGAPHATQGTVEIAKAADMLLLPTGLSLDDLIPTVLLANSLVGKHGIPLNKISFVLCRTGNSSREIEDAKDYLSNTPYHLLTNMLADKTGYRIAQDAGLSIIETQFKSLKAQAETLIDEIISRFEELTN